MRRNCMLCQYGFIPILGFWHPILLRAPSKGPRLVWAGAAKWRSRSFLKPKRHLHSGNFNHVAVGKRLLAGDFLPVDSYLRSLL